MQNNYNIEKIKEFVAKRIELNEDNKKPALGRSPLSNNSDIPPQKPNNDVKKQSIGKGVDVVINQKQQTNSNNTNKSYGNGLGSLIKNANSIKTPNLKLVSNNKNKGLGKGLSGSFENTKESYYYTKNDFNSLNEFVPAAMIVAPTIGWGIHKGLNVLSDKIKAAREKRKLKQQQKQEVNIKENYYYNDFNNNINKFNMNYIKNNYLMETYDEFINRKAREDQNYYDAGYEDGFEFALYSVLEMIEDDASYSEVYESIGEYLLEQEEQKKPGFLRRHAGKIAAGAAAGTAYKRGGGKFSDLGKTNLNQIGKRMRVGAKLGVRDVKKKMGVGVFANKPKTSNSNEVKALPAPAST